MKRLTELRRKIQALQDRPEEAVDFIKEAAALGDYECIRTLVGAYTHGELGLEVDRKEAFHYTRLGAGLGEGWCQYNCAVCLRQGIGTEPDAQEARKWMLLAAEADQVEAYLPAAQMLAMAEGGLPDFKQAIRWAKKCLEEGPEADRAEARDLLGNIYNEEGIYKMRSGQHEGARFLFQEGIQLGNMDCAVNLAYEYSLADGVGKDDAQTFRLSLEAADAGQLLGMYNVSMYYREGHGVTKDERQAFEWMRNAAKSGLKEAWVPLAQHYLYGVGVQRNLDQALCWAKKADSEGLEAAHTVLTQVLDAF